MSFWFAFELVFVACAIVSPFFAAAIVGSLCFKKSRRIGLRGSKYAAIAVTIALVACIAVNAALGNGSPFPFMPMLLTGGASFTVGTLFATVRSWLEMRGMRTGAR